MDKTTSNVRRKQWLDTIQACNASGLTKKAWCEQNGIKLKSFYYWQRQLRREAYDAQAASLPAKADVTFAEVAIPSSENNATQMRDSTIDFHPDAVIQTRSLTIEASNTASKEVLSLIRSVMKHAT